MEYKELRQKVDGELQKILDENREKLRDMRFKIASKQLKNIREIRVVKKIIARIQTILVSKKNEQIKI